MEDEAASDHSRPRSMSQGRVAKTASDAEKILLLEAILRCWEILLGLGVTKVQTAAKQRAWEEIKTELDTAGASSSRTRLEGPARQGLESLDAANPAENPP